MRAKAIVAAADTLPDTARAAFVAVECGDDEALRTEVTWLQRPLDEPDAPEASGRNVSGREAPDLSGAQVEAAAGSDYRVLRQLGRGGMGVVYLAERRFGDGLQRVALKLLDAEAWPEEDASRRLASEARILAGLSHPNIAGLLDAGRMRDGQPFLAMEYVEGERIDRWCAARTLSLQARIRLFLKVCAAVQYAHRHLVIHRDLKPANILVDADGEPKLLDFGIARLLGDGAAARTETGQHALTLAYASPEQIRNQTLSTASDVWQLGVVLYELVSGVRPFPQSESPLTLTHAILSGEVPPPSRARSAGAATARPGAERRLKIPADIDAIVLKAMRAAPGERYAGVADLAIDLQRHLDSRPVLARRGQWWYRARRFVHRYRSGVAVAVVIAALLAGFAVEREAQLRQTQLERDKAQALADFMRGLFEDADPSRTRGNRLTVAQALELGVERLRDGGALAPEVRAALLLSVGRGYTALDMGDRAIPLLREADALLQRTGAPPIERGRTKAALRRAYSMALDTASATVAGHEAIALLEQAPDADPDEILRVRINLLFDHLTVGDRPLDGLVAELESIVDGLQSRDDAQPELLIQGLAALAMAHTAAGSDGVAAGHADRALSIARRLYGADDPALLYYRFTAALARVRSDPAAAVQAYRHQIADYERMNDGPTPGLGAMLAYLGWTLERMGRHQESVAALRRAEAVSGRFAGVSPDFHLHVLSGLAAQYHRLGLDDEAVSLLQPRLARMAERAHAGTSWVVNSRIRGLNVLGGVALRRGDGEEAVRHFLLALEAAERHPDLAQASLRAASLAGMCSADGEKGEACSDTRPPHRPRKAASTDK
ncbi:protein kinase domain-containing protein [Lysobacter sp. A421]